MSSYSYVILMYESDKSLYFKRWLSQKQLHNPDEDFIDPGGWQEVGNLHDFFIYNKSAGLLVILNAYGKIINKPAVDNVS